jgi:hypothetical protein
MDPTEVWLLRAIHPSTGYYTDAVEVRAYARFDLLRKALRSQLRVGTAVPCKTPERWTCFRLDLVAMTVEPLSHDEVLG